MSVARLNFSHGPLEQHLLIISAGEKVIRLLPPLNISDADLQEGLTILADVLA